MKIYMLFPKTREIVKEAQKEGNKISTYSKGLVVSKITTSGVNEFKTYSYLGELKKIVRHDEIKYSDSTMNRFRVELAKGKLLKENTVTRFNDGMKVLFENWTMRLDKNVEKAKKYSAEYKTFEGKVGERKQTHYLFRYI